MHACLFTLTALGYAIGHTAFGTAVGNHALGYAIGLFALDHVIGVTVAIAGGYAIDVVDSDCSRASLRLTLLPHPSPSCLHACRY